MTNDEQLHWTERGLAGKARHWLEYLGSRGWLPIVAILLATAGTWGFIAIADEVSDNDTRSFDLSILEAVGGRYDTLSGFWQEVGRDLTALGGTAAISLMTLGVVIFLGLGGRWKAMLFVIASVVGGLVISLILKEIFDRPRPDVFAHRSHTMTPSFPSGHSANSAVAWLTMAVLLAKLVKSPGMKAYIFGIGLLIPLLVGLSRVFLGVHWPTDVIAGWLIGLSWALVVWGAATWLQRSGKIEEEGTLDMKKAT